MTNSLDFSKQRIHFEVEETPEGNYSVTGFVDGRTEFITCVGKHRNALDAGTRWKKRELAKRRVNNATQTTAD